MPPREPGDASGRRRILAEGPAGTDPGGRGRRRRRRAGRWGPKRIALAVIVALVVVWLARQGGRRPAPLRRRHAERHDARGALLRRRQRLHADLRPDARGQHGARLALPARRLPRARDAGALVQAGDRRRRLGLSLSPATTDATYSLLGWIVPLLIATAIIGVIGVLIQQVFLRWNQGQDLRQALITIALSVIIADQMLAAFGGISQGHQDADRLARQRSTCPATSASASSAAWSCSARRC